MVIIKKGIILLLTLLMLALGVTQVVAQPMVFGPQEIIDKSELIVVGTVVENLTDAKERTVTLKVDGVLKGDYNKKVLTMTMKKPADGNWLDFNFPNVGHQVFLPLIMSSSTEYGFISDLFNVGLIKDGKVLLFNPNNISSDSINDYESVYSDFVTSNIKIAGVKVEEQSKEQAAPDEKVVVSAEEQASADAPVVVSENTNTDNSQVQNGEEKQTNEQNQVFKAEQIVKKNEAKNSHYQPRVRESITIAIWLVIIFYSLSLVNIGRKDV